MKVILSPAKQMRREEELLPWTKPVFHREAEQVLQALKSHTPQERKQIWNCSAKLAEENEERLRVMNLAQGVSPALFSYIGLAYKYLSADALTDTQLGYLQDHLRILSALYGVLKPMDGIVSYRLEMAAPLSVDGSKDLYAFWGSRIAEEVLRDDSCVIDLASKEYSDALTPHLNASQKLIRIVFLQESDGRRSTKATLAKMARGSMVRWMAEEGIEEPEQLRYFDRGYRFSSSDSDETNYVFLEI